VNLRRAESEPTARSTVSVVRMRALLALLLGACGCLAGTAAANGDPASDVLLSENVFLPDEAPSASAAKALKRAVEAAYAHHFRIKVAVIAGQIDLGTVPSLYGKPKEYARFLGTELESLYVGPLLIVMPVGFGIYDGGRSVAAEERVLESISVRGPDSESLTRTAVDAVDRLVSSGALRSKDIRAPFVAALPLTVRRGAVARLAFRVGDDSGWSRIVARVMVKSRVIATRRSRLLRVAPSKPVSLRWRASRNLPNRGVRVCVVASDATGNRSAKTCSLARVL
jgi:hypothetical protein